MKTNDGFELRNSNEQNIPLMMVYLSQYKLKIEHKVFQLHQSVEKVL